MVAFRQGDPSGQIAFDDLAPGKYAIMVFSQAKPYAVARTSSSAGESSGHSVNVTPGAALGVTAFLTAGVVSIEGVVHKMGKPVAGIRGALVPDDPEMHIELVRGDQSDLDGRVLVRRVRPSSHT